MSRTVCIAIVLLGGAWNAPAQWLNHAAPGTPRTPDGKPNLTAPAPRAKDGRPDLSGVWQVEPTPQDELKRLFGDLSGENALGDNTGAYSKYLVDILADFQRDQNPFRPEWMKVLAQRRKEVYPLTRCLPVGPPADDVLPGPFKVIQTPGLIVMRNEYENSFRQIYTDGRKVPDDPFPLWLGYSIGKWDGDTLVVDTTGFNDQGWLDGEGHPRSEALHLSERFHRRDFGHIDMEITVDDPKVYTRPFTIRFAELLQPDSDVTEYFCNENERDRTHIK